MAKGKTGVLLINLGTPDSPGTEAVRRYLAEFLMDPYVVDLPWLARWLLVHAIILPRRPRKSAEAYAKIWTERGSPLLTNSTDLATQVARVLGDGYHVELGMRYGAPSISSAVERLALARVNQLIVIPLFPQYSLAATQSAIVEFERVRALHGVGVETTVIRDFYQDERMIAAFADVSAPLIARHQPDYVLMSFHGLPERHVKRTSTRCLASPNCCDRVERDNRLCYRAQSYATARALAARLGLASDRYGVSFQSRLGRTPWIKPYTDHLYAELPRRGIRRLLVISPSFVADCLETLEEIEIRGREQFKACGGEELWLVPSLNSSDAWVQAVAGFVRSPPSGE